MKPPARVKTGSDSAKKGKARITRLPLSRVKLLMKCTSEVDNISRDANILATRATEMFLNLLANDLKPYMEGSKKLTYKQVAQCVQTEERLTPFREMIPYKIKVKDLRERMERRRRHDQGLPSSDEEEKNDNKNEEGSSGDNEEELPPSPFNRRTRSPQPGPSTSA